MRRIWFIIPLLLCCACRPTTPNTPVNRGFYFWRSDFSLSPKEIQAIRELHISTLYSRFFDVVWENNRATPIATLSFSTPPPKNVQIVPTVFIRNEVFINTTDQQEIAQLASKVIDQIQRIAKPQNLSIFEVQMDCDWTETTKDAYFAFLSALQKKARNNIAASISISATIRLHQIKFRERTGVPPVKRGMLMFYNMGPIDADASTDAIFDKKIASQYLSRLPEYPLPLDATLPIWSWTIQLRRNQVVNLLQQTDEATLQNTSWLKPVENNRYEAAKNGFLAGKMIRKGDQLETETITSEETETAARMLHKAMTVSSKPTRLGCISLFSLSERNLRNYETKRLNDTLSLFQ